MTFANAIIPLALGRPLRVDSRPQADNLINMAKDPTKLQTSKMRLPMRVLNTKGLAIIMVGAVVIVALFRARRSDVPVIVKDFLGSSFVYGSGWLVAAIILVISLICFRVVFTDHRNEVDRIAKERDRLQNKLLEKAEGKEKT